MATFTNQATLYYNDTVVNSNTVTGEILEVLSMTKTALTETYRGGDTLTYVVSIFNSGAAALSGLTLTDDLGAYAFDTRTLVPLEYVDGSLRAFVNGVLAATPPVTAGSSLVITNLSIPAGGNLILIYSVTVNGFAPLDAEGSVTNTAVLTGSGFASVTASETVTANSDALLTITKAISPTSVVNDQPITYTFTIQNYGASAVGSEGNAVVSDTFDPILSDLSVILNGVALSEGVGYTYDEATGIFTTVAGVITVPAAAFTQDDTTGEVTLTPGTAVLTVTGTV